MQSEHHTVVLLAVDIFAAAIHKFTFLCNRRFCSFITDSLSCAILQAIENHYHITSDGHVSVLSFVNLCFWIRVRISLLDVLGSNFVSCS